MRISIIVEGKTEKAFMPYLREYLARHLSEKMPKLGTIRYDGRIPKEIHLQRRVLTLLTEVDHVIALTDVYTGTQPPDFADADDAKKKMRDWVGEEERFHPHAAQYEFEAWLLPYWPEIQRLAGHDKRQPAVKPETVNHNNPPSHRIKEIFRIGKQRYYSKERDARRILQGQDLSIAIQQCSELKALVNTIITICGGNVIP